MQKTAKRKIKNSKIRKYYFPRLSDFPLSDCPTFLLPPTPTPQCVCVCERLSEAVMFNPTHHRPFVRPSPDSKEAAKQQHSWLACAALPARLRFPPWPCVHTHPLTHARTHAPTINAPHTHPQRTAFQPSVLPFPSLPLLPFLRLPPPSTHCFAATVSIRHQTNHTAWTWTWPLFRLPSFLPSFLLRVE